LTVQNSFAHTTNQNWHIWSTEIKIINWCDKSECFDWLYVQNCFGLSTHHN